MKFDCRLLGRQIGGRGSFKSFIAFDWAMRAAMAGEGVAILSDEGAGIDRRADAAYTLAANPDAEYVVDRPNPQGMMVSVTRDRFKDTPSFPPLRYTASTVNLERTDKYDRPVSSLVLESDDSPVVVVPKEKKVRLGGNQKIVLRVIGECGGDQDAVKEEDVFDKAAVLIDAAKPRQQVKQARGDY